MNLFDYPIEDVARVLFWATVDMHDGQYSEGYEAQCIMTKIYRPSALELGIDWDNPIQVDIWTYWLDLAESKPKELQEELLNMVRVLKEELDYQAAYHAETGR